MGRFPPLNLSIPSSFRHTEPGLLSVSIEATTMATPAPNPAENDIHVITQQLRTALTTQEGRAHIPADIQFSSRS